MDSSYLVYHIFTQASHGHTCKTFVEERIDLHLHRIATAVVFGRILCGQAVYSLVGVYMHSLE